MSGQYHYRKHYIFGLLLKNERAGRNQIDERDMDPGES